MPITEIKLAKGHGFLSTFATMVESRETSKGIDRQTLDASYGSKLVTLGLRYQEHLNGIGDEEQSDLQRPEETHIGKADFDDLRQQLSRELADVSWSQSELPPGEFIDRFLDDIEAIQKSDHE